MAYPPEVYRIFFLIAIVFSIRIIRNNYEYNKSEFLLT